MIKSPPQKLTAKSPHWELSQLISTRTIYENINVSGHRTIKPGDEVYSWFETRIAEQVLHSDFKQ